MVTPSVVSSSVKQMKSLLRRLHALTPLALRSSSVSARHSSRDRLEQLMTSSSSSSTPSRPLSNHGPTSLSPTSPSGLSALVKLPLPLSHRMLTPMLDHGSPKTPPLTSLPLHVSNMVVQPTLATVPSLLLSQTSTASWSVVPHSSPSSVLLLRLVATSMPLLRRPSD